MFCHLTVRLPVAPLDYVDTETVPAGELLGGAGGEGQDDLGRVSLAVAVVDHLPGVGAEDEAGEGGQGSGAHQGVIDLSHGPQPGTNLH